MTPGIEIRADPYPDLESFKALSVAAWGTPWEGSYDLEGVLRRSLVHLGAYRGPSLIGYVNVAWDGGMHAFLLDPMVHPDVRREGLGSALVKRAIELARERGVAFMSVDYEPHLAGFYERCGFQPTQAGLIRL